MVKATNHKRKGFRVATLKEGGNSLWKKQQRQRHDLLLEESNEETSQLTLGKIHEFVKMKCRYLRKYFQKRRDEHNSCGCRHNQDILNLYKNKDYQKIDSHVYSIRVRGVGAPAKNISQEKVVIKRRILNDYMNIINRRQMIVQDIQENFGQILNMHQQIIKYYNNYYSKNNNKQYFRLQNILLPEFRYILKFISNKGRQFETTIKNYDDARFEKKGTQESLKSKAIIAIQDKITKNNQKEKDSKEKKFEDSDSQLSDTADDKLTSFQKNKQQWQKAKFQSLAKTKGYFFLENTESQAQQLQQQSQQQQQSDANNNKLASFEMQKYGSDKMKLKIFESDMKQIIKRSKSGDHFKKQIYKSMETQPLSKKNKIAGHTKSKTQELKSRSEQGSIEVDDIKINQLDKQEDDRNKSQKVLSSMLSNPTKIDDIFKKKREFEVKSNQSNTMQYSSHTRIKSVGSLSQIIGNISTQPLPHQGLAQFKRFKEKYFQQSNSKEEEAKPTFQQLSLKDLKTTNIPSLPLTIKELKNTLLNQFTTYLTHSNSQESSVSAMIPESEEENTPKEGFFHQHKKPSIKIGVSHFGFSVEEKSSKEEEYKNNSSCGGCEENSQEFLKKSYFSNQRMNGLPSSSSNSDKIQNQVSDLAQKDVFIYKKLNRIYLEKIYDERILNRKSFRNVNPPHSPDQIRAMMKKHSSIKIPFFSSYNNNSSNNLNSAASSMSINNNNSSNSNIRGWKSSPFINTFLKQIPKEESKLKQHQQYSSSLSHSVRQVDDQDNHSIKLDNGISNQCKKDNNIISFDNQIATKSLIDSNQYLANISQTPSLNIIRTNSEIVPSVVLSISESNAVKEEKEEGTSLQSISSSSSSSQSSLSHSSSSSSSNFSCQSSFSVKEQQKQMKNLNPKKQISNHLTNIQEEQNISKFEIKKLLPTSPLSEALSTNISSVTSSPLSATKSYPLQVDFIQEKQLKQLTGNSHFYKSQDSNNSSNSKSSKNDMSMSSLNMFVERINDKVSNYKGEITKLQDQIKYSQKSLDKLYSLVSKKFDVCLETKSIPFKSYIKQLDMPLQQQQIQSSQNNNQLIKSQSYHINPDSNQFKIVLPSKVEELLQKSKLFSKQQSVFLKASSNHTSGKIFGVQSNKSAISLFQKKK